MRMCSPVRILVACVALTATAVAAGVQRAGAQSGPNQQALDALGPAHPQHHARRTHHAHRAAAPPAVAAIPAAPLPSIPPAPPPPPVIKAPVIVVPLHPSPPPPPVPVVAKAAGSASPLAGGVRITFGPGSADLNAATMQALQDFAVLLKSDPAARALVLAYCRGTPDDPSTPRRISLERGLAARAVLIHAGIPSTRIYVRAIGQPPDTGPAPRDAADRVDLTRSDSTQQTAAAQ